MIRTVMKNMRDINNSVKTGRIGQSIKVLGPDPDNTNSVSRTHMVVGKSHLQQYVH